ncbi:MAG: phosphoglucosamine mutase [Oscillospiraceae bacterium]|nr:phosphoglucosamine mutase [Oscillospiraceae bacterium]
MGRIFGTDGVRGIANTELSCKLAMNVGRAAAMVVAEQIARKPVILIGQDTRISSDMLRAALAAGITSVGADALLAGVLPTPAVSYLVEGGHADAGVMLSASHNSYEFNGIKIFGPGGQKLSDADEFEIERIVLDKAKPYTIRWGWELGRIKHVENLADGYIERLTQAAGNLSGLRVAVDCSNGSAVFTAGEIFAHLGANAHIIHDKPNGVNINRECGSTHMSGLMDIVRQGGYDAGIAFDGDADRCLAVDETGALVTGDQLLCIFAQDMRERGILKHDTIVATVMSNLGMQKFARENGFNLVTTKVGDRYVLEEMLRFGYNLGGEQSGHVILSDHIATGDGQLTALTLLSILKKSGKKLSELAGQMKVFPQVMINMQADAVMKSALDVDAGAKQIIEDAKAALGSEGRILVRPSGTEPLIRVMIEGSDKAEITSLCQSVTEQLKERLSHNESCKMLEGF